MEMGRRKGEIARKRRYGVFIKRGSDGDMFGDCVKIAPTIRNQFTHTNSTDQSATFRGLLFIICWLSLLVIDATATELRRGNK